MGAEYLFQTDKPYDVSYDTGDKSIQCGRHVDAFKLWLMWKAKVFMYSISATPVCVMKVHILFTPLSSDTTQIIFINKWM